MSGISVGALAKIVEAGMYLDSGQVGFGSVVEMRTTLEAVLKDPDKANDLWRAERATKYTGVFRLDPRSK
jgi:hypothetical protein